MAAGDELSALLLDDVIGEHDGLDLRHVERGLKHSGQVRRDADMPHDALFFGGEQGFQRAAGGQDRFEVVEAGVVELVEFDVVGAQVGQALGQLRFHLGAGQRAALGGQHKFVAQAQLLQRLADPRFADRVGAGGVDVVDAGLVRGFEQRPGAGLVDALDGDAAEPQAGNLQAGLAQLYSLHTACLVSLP